MTCTEQTFIGALLSEVPEELNPLLGESDFCSTKSKKAFLAISKFIERKVPDLRDSTFEVLGKEFQGFLEEAESRFGRSDSSVEDLAERLIEISTLKKLGTVFKELSKRASDQAGDAAGTLLAIAREQIDALEERAPNSSVSSLDGIKDFAERAIKRTSGEAMRERLFSGLDGVDGVVGGFSPGDLVIIAARPSMGKTAIAASMARRFASGGSPTIMVSFEMTRHQIFARLLALSSGVPVSLLERSQMSPGEQESVKRASHGLSVLPFYFTDKCGRSSKETLQLIRAEHRRHGIKAVVIDYLQLMSADGDNRNLAIGSITASLKKLAIELGITVLLLSQLSRAAGSKSRSEDAKSRKPILSDLRDSGSIEQDADIVIFIHRDSSYDIKHSSPRMVEMIVAKNRNGSTGATNAYFHPLLTAFTNNDR